MRKFQVMMLAAFAVFALSAMAASSASAEITLLAEWLISGAVVTANQPSETTGLITLEDSKAASAVLCSGILDGTVGPNGTDEVTEVLNLAKEPISLTSLTGLALLGEGATSDCQAVKGCAEGSATSPIEVWPVGLPWKTELFLMENGEILDLIVGSGYDILCLILGINTSDECKAADTELPVVNSPEGDAETPGGSLATPLATCSIGGAESGNNVTDELATITSTSGLLSVSSE